ncbi:ATP-binding protein [Hymenobacter glacialis]|uniref:histidine kinase n=1 Tax=Hymenobacter glacialis TaxID=1908236 RepID=A0A1G1T3W2_9BACT|nr:ATP-binding protein [Hymenobacter glacialis]OGX85557.1 hypothetical protein BEN48_01615 [Hymenobacter glacialis]
MFSPSFYRVAAGLVLGLLVLGRGPVAAQQSAAARYLYWEADPDSLRQVLSGQQADTARLRTLMHLADVAPTATYWTAAKPTHVEVMAEAARLSKRFRRPEQCAYRLLVSGNRLLQANTVAPALDSLRAAVAAFDRLGRPIPTLLGALRAPYATLNQPEAQARYFRTKLAYYQQRGATENIAPCLLALSGHYLSQGDYNQSLSYTLQEVALYRSFHRLAYYTQLAAVGSRYADWGNTAKALHYLQPAVAGLRQRGGDPFLPYISMAKVYVRRHDYPAALRTLDQALLSSSKRNVTPPGTKKANVFVLRSAVLLAQGHPKEAYPLLVAAQHLADSLQLRLGSFLELDATWARYYVAQGDAARAEMFWLAAYHKARQFHSTPLQLAYLRELTRFYQPRQPAKAAPYAVVAMALADSLDTREGALHVARYEIEQADRAQTSRIAGLRQAQQQDVARARRQRWVLGGVLVVLALIGGFAFLLWRSNQLKQRANALLSQQKAEIQAQRDQTAQALTELRATQAQLIQKEKMASLGELTAGIAHEIQNPLNFVNNFSEVSAELVEELQEALAARDTAEATALATDVAQNLTKITEHGRRAAAIVKGMLEHSRTSAGERAPTDLNALCQEYLRLTYQGLRAKDKSFNATLETKLAADLPLVDAVGSDLGRVLLNLFGNAFYAVRQRQLAGEPGYAPVVGVHTRRVGGGVEIRVTDNGAGVPDDIKAKIFQPFFTTKPPGQGTGLGLSLSHDIVTKGHGGALAVESHEGQGTAFSLMLPSASAL